MAISDNILLAGEVERALSEALPIRLGVNKKNELVRLAYEICRARGLTAREALDLVGIGALAAEGKNGLFHRTKSALVGARYPSAFPGCDLHIMPLKISPAAGECRTWDFKLDPKVIYVEEDIKGLDWTGTFLENFPKAEIKSIKKVSTAFEKAGAKNTASLYNERRENIFLVRNRAAFIKICPCTKSCRRCGYWILNIGFGCPVDCSYCYLQTYSRAPGIMLPANIDEYYTYIEKFDKKVRKRTRIGTGEFTDSLAFDRYTGYSSRLVPFFRKMKKLVLELKTKTTEIENILKEEPHDNVVVSWSMNTRDAAGRYEKGGAGISDRIEAASKAARRGYKIGFHFDPIVFYEGWEQEYRTIVEELFSRKEINEKTAWISLGTMRYTPGLKQISENRFSDNNIFYEGEFFADIDGKLRYPRPLRIDMYNRMIRWIRSANRHSWIYLCMEPEAVWKKTILDKKDRSFHYQREGR